MPKSGTAAMRKYLRFHPNIFMPKMKEPNYFFGEESLGLRHVKSLKGYLKLFRKSASKQSAIGEASAFYVRSSSAIKNIYDFNSRAKIIVMLRNPVDMAQSLHFFNFFRLDENVEDFEKAWRLQESRGKGYNIPKNAKFPLTLQYAWMCKLNEQVKNLLNIFPSEQVKVILFEDFKASTREVYEEVLSFLDVPSDGRTEFPIVGASKDNRVKWLAKIIRNPCFSWVIEKLSTFRFLNLGQLKRLYINIFSYNKPWKPIRSEFRKELINVFREDVEKLSQLINKDLSHWLKE